MTVPRPVAREDLCHQSPPRVASPYAPFPLPHMMCSSCNAQGPVPQFGFTSPEEREAQAAWQEAHRAVCPKPPAEFYPAAPKQ